MPLAFAEAKSADAATIAALRNAVADDLTAKHSQGWWSGHCTAKGVLHDLRHAWVFVARERGQIVGTLRLATKKPWAIDRAYFTPVARPLYLSSMAVAPTRQRRGIGRFLMQEAGALARRSQADAIVLDAFDHAAGAGDFYRKCGYREMGRVIYRGVSLIYFELLLEKKAAGDGRQETNCLPGPSPVSCRPSPATMRPAERLDRVQRVHPYRWLWEPLESDPTFVLRSMFGAKAAYLGGKLMLCFCASEEPWRGVLVCTSHEHHAALRADFPELVPHPILPKWLYLAEASDGFEAAATRLVALARRRDPRLGVVPGARKKKKAAKRAPRRQPRRGL